MNLRGLFVLGGVIASGAVAHAAMDATAWELRQTFALTGAGPTRVALPPALLDAARSDLADLRLLAPDGSELPFVILRHQRREPTVAETIAVAPRLQGTRTVIEVALTARTSVARIRLVTPAADFVKGLTVESRDGSGGWRTQVDNTLVFRTRTGSEHLVIALDGIETDALRLTLDDTRDAAVPVIQVVIEKQTEPEIPPVPREVTITSRDTTTDESRIGLDFGLRHQPLATLTIAVRDAAFERRVRLLARSVEDGEVTEQTLASDTLRRIALPGGRSFSELTISASITTPAALLELAIDNGDSPPLTVESVTAGLRAVHVAFQAPGAGAYTVLAGRPNAVAPRYDVEAFAKTWRELPVSAPVFGVLEKNPAFQPTEPTPDVPELAGPFDPQGWSIRRTVTITTPGAQVLELDPAALADARPDLVDIRLARGDRQVPFLLEIDSRKRSFPLTLIAAPDAKRPNVGRWKLSLPHAGIPISQVFVRVAEPLFARAVTLWEFPADTRGESYARRLGSAAWSRNSAQDADRFAIVLLERPLTAELVLEIDHGDNQPFAPLSAEAAYPIRRLRFRASTPGELTLHYGHPTAHAPRYDLALAAPRLLAAREHVAELHAFDGSGGVERGVFSLGGRGAKIAFWLALGLVVVVLVWLVARLLPKPPDPAA